MFHGSIVALVTPMQDDGALDEAALQSLLEFHIDHGTDAIVTMGTTGESATLDEKEHCYVIRRVVEMVAARIPVIAGTGANSTTEAVRLTQCALDAGADAALLVTPYYNKPGQEGLYQHYKAVAAAVPIPQILYNVPGRTACDLLPETVERLSTISNIIGIKEATGDLGRVVDIRRRCGEGFALYSGDDASSMEFMRLGGHGVISVTANVAPGMMHDLCAAVRAGDLEQAGRINSELDALHNDLFVEANPIPVKWALCEMGLIGKGIRLPLTWLADENHARVRQALSQVGLVSS
ncbi:MAG: 4-hydroxy-tetrahydrodipicolinate synthase [Gammaproteobacteria bacterium]|nr:4-hydroxy-tetrahydrodipicolinate synthase [Gammaproteobacteria bacterium]